MKQIHPLTNRKSSVSLPHSAQRRLYAAQKVFARNGLCYSEQEIYRQLFKLFLRNWRGRGLKTNSMRRYNADGKLYRIRPLYINQVLYAALWQRALHSGESISRMLDFAIRVYLSRLVEELLRKPVPWSKRSGRNSDYWARRYGLRKHPYGDFFINYTCRTTENIGNSLQYMQKTEIIYKSGLSPIQIFNLMHKAA